LLLLSGWLDHAHFVVIVEVDEQLLLISGHRNDLELIL
jgi:hypothetical protein